MRYLSFSVVLVLLSGCVTFRHNAIPVTSQITTLLEEISKDADKVGMTPLQRRQFSAVVMIPAIDATSKLTTCLLDGVCKDVTVHLTNLSRALLIGINNFISQLPNSNIKNSLLARLNSAIVFVTNLYTKFGGKIEAEISTLVVSLSF